MLLRPIQPERYFDLNTRRRPHLRLRKQNPKGVSLPYSGEASVRLANIPNFITLGRIFAVPVVFWLLLRDETKLAFFIFLAAGISDAIDGYLAKRFHWQSELGAYLDPLADKLLIVSIFLALGSSGNLPLWLVLAVVMRDLMIVAAVLLSWLMDHPVRIKPFIISKANTTAQIMLASLVLADEGFALGLVNLRAVLVWVTGILTILSLGAYLVTWQRHMTGAESTGSKNS